MSESPMSLPTPDLTIDVGHEGCGTLLVLLRQRMQELAPGAVLEVVAYDPGAREDLPAWCRMTRNELARMTGRFRRLRGASPPVGVLTGRPSPARRGVAVRRRGSTGGRAKGDAG